MTRNGYATYDRDSQNYRFARPPEMQIAAQEVKPAVPPRRLPLLRGGLPRTSRRRLGSGGVPGLPASQNRPPHAPRQASP